MDAFSIKLIVCETFGIDVSDFVIMGRSEKFSHARFAYFVLCRKFTKMTLKCIAESVQLKYPAVIVGIKRHDDLMIINNIYAKKYKKSLVKIKHNHEQNNK